MKNCYLSRSVVDDANSFAPPSESIVVVDVESTELFEKLNPVLSDGHRANLLTRLIDKNVPREVADVVSQLVVNVPHDSTNRGWTDEQIKNTIVSRHFENEIELEQVRRELDVVLGDMFPDVVPPDTGSSGSVPPETGSSDSVLPDTGSSGSKSE